MSAIPIIPGQLYRLRCTKFDVQVFAPHPCDALCLGLAILAEHERIRSKTPAPVSRPLC